MDLLINTILISIGILITFDLYVLVDPIDKIIRLINKIRGDNND